MKKRYFLVVTIWIVACFFTRTVKPIKAIVIDGVDIEGLMYCDNDEKGSVMCRNKDNLVFVCRLIQASEKNNPEKRWYPLGTCQGGCQLDESGEGGNPTCSSGRLTDNSKIEEVVKEKAEDITPVPIQENSAECVSTALGCISPNINQFTSKLLEIIFGIAGGIAFLLMVWGFILIATSSGDEKKVQGARETITSAIIGLLISIFSLFIFRLIAVNILQIPGIN